MTLSPDKFLLVGIIVAPFGLNGQVKLRSITDYPEHIGRRIDTVYLGDKRTPYRLGKVFEHKPGLLVLALEGVGGRETAEDLRGTEVFILETEAVPLAEGEYYLHQLYGLRVETTDGVELGQVREVLQTGSNDVLVVARPQERDALIPMIHDVVQELDLPGGRIVINVIPGLL